MEQRISTLEIRMNGVTIENKIRNEYTRNRIGVTSIADIIQENRWNEKA